MRAVRRRHPIALVAIATTFCLLAAQPPASRAADADRSGVVRLAVVNAPYQSGLMAALLSDFERSSGYRVDVSSGNDALERADRGAADIVIAHLGKAGVQAFVTSGKGRWPQTVFANQVVLVGPRADPAGVRGMTDPFAAMKKIAARKTPFACAVDPGTRYVCEMLLAGAGNPDRNGWYLETRETRGRAMQFAESQGAYAIWGSFPFERFRRTHDTTLEVMVWDTAVFQRVMAAIVVDPQHFPDANVAGASALEAWLLSPAVQAAVAAYREPGLDRPTWWPAGRSNNPAQLLGVPGDDDAEE